MSKTKSLSAPHLPPQRANARTVAEIIGQIRAGSRPSLVGQIVGLTAEMERAYRTSQVFPVEKSGHYSLMMTDFDKQLAAPWQEIGLPDSPSEEAKVLAYEAYQAWRGTEIFARAEGDEAVNMAVAQGRFAVEFGRYGLQLLNPRTAQEVDFLRQLIGLLPEKVLKHGNLKTIDLNGKQAAAVILCKYNLPTSSLRLINTAYDWDVYFFTQVALLGIGYAACYTLIRDTANRYDRHIEFNRFNDLYLECNERKAEYLRTMDPSRPWEGQAFVNPGSFFAVNFLQYMTLGEGMIDRGGTWDARRRVFEFFRQIFPLPWRENDQ